MTLMIPAAIAGLLLLPLISLRRRTLVAWYGVDLATWLFAFIVWRRTPDLDPYLAFVALCVVKLAAFAVFLARGTDVRFSANRAAAIAAIVYALTIPAMLRAPIDGDEPFYLLVTESMLHDRDLDLANQYRTLHRTASGRTDLVPQLGDPTGARGEQYSRHEPLLPLLMLPGYALGGLPGAVAVIALFGVLLIRSTIRWMEDEEIDERSIRAVFPLFAFGPPVLFYATRLWPEVPAAFFYVEALRGLREQRMKRWVPALLGLVLLKLRFVLIALGFVAAIFFQNRRSGRAAILAAVIALVPLVVMWIAVGHPTSVHSWTELVPSSPELYAIGFFGLLADGMSGIAFRAPFYLLGLFALLRWRSMPRAVRFGVIGASIYVLFLLPRAEWFGGWAPPLRYVVFLMPVLAVGAAAVWDRISRGVIAIVALATVALVVHGATYPWRLFHIANGENAAGEWLSARYGADFSRIFPSFIRLNESAWIGAAAVVLIILFIVPLHSRTLRRPLAAAVIALFALGTSAAYVHAMRPASVVHFEDAHVKHEGGELYPELYTILRVAYRGGWLLHAGDSLSFLAREGEWTLHYVTGVGAVIEIGGEALQLPAADGYRTVRVSVPSSGRTTLRCLSGAVNVDRMERND